MKQVSVVISTYTSDVSGVCSALYELGGMVVIHDPSGCNSTYNTHDEPRWFSKDSLIFISGLSQMDAVMGNDEKFIEDILRAAKELQPRFIALVRSPIPLMIGTDFEGIAWEIEQRCGIPTFFIPTTGMKSYVRGAGMAFETFVNRFLPEKSRDSISKVEVDSQENYHEEDVKEDLKKRVSYKEDSDKASSEKNNAIKVNILGATPLDLSVNGTYASLKKYIEDCGFLWNGSLAFETDFESVMDLPKGDVNLVISANGLLAAKAMEEKYEIPYVVGFPVGCVKQWIRDAIIEAVQEGKNIVAMEGISKNSSQTIECDNFKKNEDYVKNARQDKNGSEKRTVGYLIHEPVIAASVAQAISQAFSITVKPLTMLEPIKEVEGTKLEWIASEEEMKKRLEDGDFVIADPMFRPICKKEMPFYSLPHEAFSGRIYRKEIPNLVEILG